MLGQFRKRICVKNYLKKIKNLGKLINIIPLSAVIVADVRLGEVVQVLVGTVVSQAI